MLELWENLRRISKMIKNAIAKNQIARKNIANAIMLGYNVGHNAIVVIAIIIINFIVKF